MKKKTASSRGRTAAHTQRHQTRAALRLQPNSFSAWAQLRFSSRSPPLGASEGGSRGDGSSRSRSADLICSPLLSVISGTFQPPLSLPYVLYMFYIRLARSRAASLRESCAKTRDDMAHLSPPARRSCEPPSAWRVMEGAGGPPNVKRRGEHGFVLLNRFLLFKYRVLSPLKTYI